MGRIIDFPGDDYNAFLDNTAKVLSEYNIKGIAVVALLDNDDTVLTGYWNMGQVEKSYAAVHIQADAISQMIENNIDKYIEFID